MKKIMILALCLVLCLASLTGCCLKHNWEEANCEQPRTCTECGKTEGSKGDHVWERATCQHPKTCEICGKERGELGDHKWRDATCTEPAVCRYCGETKGQAAGHRWDGNECQECGQIRDVPATEAPAPEAPALLPPVMDGVFTFTPEEFLERYAMEAAVPEIPVTLGSKRYATDSMIAYYMDCQGAHVLKVNIILDETTGSITQIQIKPEDGVYSNDEISKYVRFATVRTVFAVCPDLTEDQWSEISANPESSYSRNGKTTDTFVINGVKFTFVNREEDGSMELTCVPE